MDYKPWGGTRKGAGRPRLNRVKISASVDRKTFEAIEFTAKAASVSAGTVIDKVVTAILVKEKKEKEESKK